MRKSLCLSLVFLGLLIELVNTRKMTLTENKVGTIDGYSYELWKDYGNTKMELWGAGFFYCEWSEIGNALFRIGKKWDCTQYWQEVGTITIDYSVDYNPSGNSYLCVYGWTKNPLIEYYIVESWGSWRPPGGYSQGKINVDGGTYDVYVTDRINQPSIDGNATFRQFWSVRTAKKTQGTVTVNKHFEAWTSKGLQLGKLCEASLNVEGYQSSGWASVQRNEVKIGY